MLVLKEHNHCYYPGCHKDYLLSSVEEHKLNKQPESINFKNSREANCFSVRITKDNDEIKEVSLKTSYYIGLSYIPEWGIPLMVKPKLNNEAKTNFYFMLTEALREPENFNHLEDLMDIKFKSDWVEVPPDSQVELTPFLIIQFLMAVKLLVRKGLKKSYYTKTENLKSKVKGKILVGDQLKQNVYKNRLTQTVCQYQEFGFDIPENRFIKYVMRFVFASIANYKDQSLKTTLVELLRYNLAAFSQVGEEKFKIYSKKESNPFYKIYNTVYNLGNQILKLVSHSYENTTKEMNKYPPHWIDMSKLFELYVYKKLREKFPKPDEVKYHLKVNYQELDYLIKSENFKAVVDAKYKPRYKGGRPTKEDARQLSGYARLNDVYKQLGLDESSELIPVYIIYPRGLDEIKTTENLLKSGEDLEDDEAKNSILCGEIKVRIVSSYKKMYLQEISLPRIQYRAK